MIVVYNKGEYEGSSTKHSVNASITFKTMRHAFAVFEIDGDMFRIVKNRVGPADELHPIDELPATIAHFTVMWLRWQEGLDTGDHYCYDYTY